MKVPTYREVEKISKIDRTPLDRFVERWEPSLLIDDTLNDHFRKDLQDVVDWLLEQPQVTCAECNADCRYDGPFYCSEHQR